MHNKSDDFQVIVIGAGHAGIEAALAAARLGCRTLCVCTNLDSVGNLPCNPSIGGTAKGQLVREIDALGGEMARAADATCLQFRMLNRGKGPAVFSPRCQTDRMAYRNYMRKVLDSQENLFLIQGECAKIMVEDAVVFGIEMAGGRKYFGRAVILATGTFLKAKTFVGKNINSSGPDGLHSADLLSANLTQLGLALRRFKTGTPPRIDGATVDFSKFTVQHGDENPQGFSYMKETEIRNVADCYLSYTNSQTHSTIVNRLSDSPLYSGDIEGVGPRYCPSIEDKVVRFKDKERHQIFLEPCGENMRELYVQGLSTSMPEDVQHAFLTTIPGLEHAHIVRPGYAIEYDCLDPLCLNSSLQVREIEGLYACGQICGSSGYEEAAAQGLVAGINAAHHIQCKSPFSLKRSDGYIGTLIDDLITKGCDEPYRMMTSRCEHRLICRQDNADIRLSSMGHALGLISDERHENVQKKYEIIEIEAERLRKTFVSPSPVTNDFLESMGTAPLSPGKGASLAELLRRPEILYENLKAIDPNPQNLEEEIANSVEITIKYEGYIKRQLAEVEEQKRMENSVIPLEIEYLGIKSIRTEARQKLDKIRPETIGQAGRISGVSPSDIGALMIHIAGMRKAIAKDNDN